MELIEKIRPVLEKEADIHYAFLFGSALKGIRKEGDIDILISGELDFNKKVELSSS